MQLADLAGRRVAVWGPGAEGLALAHAAARFARPRSLVFLADEPAGLTPDVAAAIAALGATALPVPTAGWDEVDVLVRTAGVSRYRPEVGRAMEGGVAHTTPTALWFTDHRDRRVVAVTGTKGKSTTAALIHHLLLGSGQQAVLAGNIGAPHGEPLPALYGRDNPDERFVVEVSSYQTADLDNSPELAVVTNLSPDHLPWHDGDVEIYYRDKLNLLARRPSMTSVLNAADDELRMRAGEATNPVWFCGDDGYRVAGSAIVGPDGPVVEAAALRLRGRFNLENCCAALTAIAAWGFRIELGHAGALLASFEPLTGRFEVVRRIGGLDFVVDALASNPAGAVAAVRAVSGRPLILIVGGQDRRVGFADLAAEIAGRSEPVALVALPDNGLEIAEAIRAARPGTAVASCSTVGEAVAAAAEIAGVDGVVLFAPAAPTPARLGNYADRTADFKTAVAALPDK